MAGELIMIVDDDSDIREIVTMYLEREGYAVIATGDGNQAIEYALSTDPDLIIMDMMLPGLDGIEVCQELRKKTVTPIIFLSCRSTPQDISLGLAAGGDDYMGKPFDTIELIARVKAHLRRNRILENTKSVTGDSSKIRYPGLAIDLKKHSVTAYGDDVSLSPKEFELLALLAQNTDKTFSNEELFSSLWDTESLGDYRSLMVHISNIRKKIEKDPKDPVFIHTIKGVGYRFSIAPASLT